jgi:hypothetical protein
MGNTRSGGTAGGSGSTGREDAVPTTPRASGGLASPAPAARRGPGEPGPRSSPRERGSAGPGNAMRPCSDRQQNGASDVVKNSASGSLSRDSDRSAGSPACAESPMTGNSRNGGTSSLSKKRKNTQRTPSYLKRFKPVEGSNTAGMKSSQGPNSPVL